MSGAPDWIRTSICRFRRSVPLRSSHWSVSGCANGNRTRLPGFADRSIAALASRIMAAPFGIEPRTFAFRERRSTAELRGIDGQGERIRTSALRIPSAELCQTELHPEELERATGLEPACPLIRNQMFLQLNYARMFGAADGI
jgi:hypothetical protein